MVTTFICYKDNSAKPIPTDMYPILDTSVISNRAIIQVVCPLSILQYAQQKNQAYTKSWKGLWRHQCRWQMNLMALVVMENLVKTGIQNTLLSRLRMALLTASRARIQVPCFNIRAMANVGTDKGLGHKMNEHFICSGNRSWWIAKNKTVFRVGNHPLYWGSLLSIRRLIRDARTNSFQILGAVKKLDWLSLLSR